MHKTVFDEDFQIVPSDDEFSYQSNLTSKLDRATIPFNQDIINEIVLWKVNRYVEIDAHTLNLINNIDINSSEVDFQATRIILKALLQIKGIQLPMASTILRFKNKNIYQIIDQRVYRIIYKNKLKLKTYSTDKNLNQQIDLYFQYLNDLKIVCKKLNISFDKADRILYEADKRINKDVLLDNY